MRTDVKKKWITALKSGKYVQSQHALRNTSGYCCLGVLCDIYRKTKKKKGVCWTKSYEFKKTFLGETNYLPKEVRKWAGMESELVFSTSIERNLARMNDADMQSFNKIADYINSNL